MSLPLRVVPVTLSSSGSALPQKEKPKKRGGRRLVLDQRGENANALGSGDVCAVLEEARGVSSHIAGGGTGGNRTLGRWST